MSFPNLTGESRIQGYGLDSRFRGKETIMKGNKENKQNFPSLKWEHAGGKLREVGSQSLTDAELLSILISSGIKGKSAEGVAKEILEHFGSLRGISNQPLKKFLKIKGLGDVKIIRIAAAFEIARRMVKEVLKEYEEKQTI